MRFIGFNDFQWLHWWSKLLQLFPSICKKFNSFQRPSMFFQMFSMNVISFQCTALNSFQWLSMVYDGFTSFLEFLIGFIDFQQFSTFQWFSMAFNDFKCAMIFRVFITVQCFSLALLFNTCQWVSMISNDIDLFPNEFHRFAAMITQGSTVSDSDRDPLSNLRFADDVILLASNPSDISAKW